MVYIYPACFHPNEDGSITITFPDLPGCISEGKNLQNAMEMAESALKEWIAFLKDEGSDIAPQGSDMLAFENDSDTYSTLIKVEVKDNRAVRKTVSIPQWMADRSADEGLSLSKILQDALEERWK